jgi:predicted transcriptional regulator of viral defense system
LAGGYYLLADREINEMDLFMIANKIYEPSYVSLESALAYYTIIPESVLGVTSISSRKTNEFASAWGIFRYRSIKPPLIGYQVLQINQSNKFKIAFLEKAILDYLYLNPDIHTPADFEGLRWNKQQLNYQINTSVFEKYLRIFSKNALEIRAEKFMEYLNA